MRCGRCKEEKPESEFAPSVLAKGRGWCRSCNREYHREYRRRVRAEGREARESMRCGRCKEEKPAADFPPSELARGSGWCRACYRECNRRVRATPEGREAARKAGRESARRARSTPEGLEANRARSLLSRYGLTEGAFATMIVAQGGRCAICGTTEPGGHGAWHVDHDHSCCAGRVTCGGKCVRGLLCQRCNTGLGYFRDNAEALHAAGDYLEKRGNRARQPDSLTT